MSKFASAIIMLSHIPILATVVSLAIFYKKLSRTVKIFSWFIFVSGAVQFISLFLWHRDINNMPLLHLYVPGGFICLAWFYQSFLSGFIHYAVLPVITIVFVVCCVANTLFVQSAFTFNSYALIAEAGLVVTLSLFTFLFFLNQTVRESELPDMKSLVWINSGLFIYFLSCFLLYYFSNFMMMHFSLGLRRITWIFHSFFSVVMYTCFLIGLWRHSKTRN